MDEGVTAVRTMMNLWEERNDDAKEEMLEFWTSEEDSVSVLSSLINASANVNNRIKRAIGSWWKVEANMRSSRLIKKWQRTVVEACVESDLLDYCHARI